MFRRFAYEHLALHCVPQAEGDPAVPPVPSVPPVPPAAPSVPWGDKVDTVYNIGDKPWWETATTEGPTRELLRTKQYANPTALADAYYALNQSYAQKEAGLTVPAADAKPEVWNDFYSKLGRPESPDKYEVKAPDGVELDDGMVKFAKDTAFKLGLPPAKTQEMVNEYLAFEQAYAAQAQKDAEAKNNADIEALKTQHGANYDKFVADGRVAFKALGLPEEVVAGAEQHMGAAAIITIMAKLGELSSEGKLTTGQPEKGGLAGKMTAEQARVKIAELRGDPKFNEKFGDARHPEHANAVKEMEDLYAVAG